MAYTFTIGTDVYASLDETDGIKALSCVPLSPKVAQSRYHVPGVAGNYLMRMGRAGVVIICEMKWVGVLATILADYESKLIAYSDTAQTIITPAGKSWTRCSLLPEQMKMIAKPKGIGDFGTGTAKADFDVQAIFMCDSGLDGA